MGHPAGLYGTGRPHDPPRGQRSSLLSRRGRVGGGAWRAGAGPAAGAQSPGRGLREVLGRGLGWDPAGAMELLSALSLGELALSFSRVPLFPVFDLSYFIVSILYLKYEPGEPEPAAHGGWHCGAGGGGKPAGREAGEALDHGGAQPQGLFGGAAGAGIVRFFHMEWAGEGERQEGGQGEKPPGWWGWGRGSRCGLDGGRGMRLYGGGGAGAGEGAGREGQGSRQGRMNLSKRHRSW